MARLSLEAHALFDNTLVSEFSCIWRVFDTVYMAAAEAAFLIHPRIHV
jgi:hypothetical protein